MMLIQLSPRLARHLASQSLDGIKLSVFLKYNDLKVSKSWIRRLSLDRHRSIIGQFYA